MVLPSQICSYYRVNLGFCLFFKNFSILGVLLQPYKTIYGNSDENVGQ